MAEQSRALSVAGRSDALERARGQLGVMPDGGKTKALGTASCRRRRLPGDTLIEFELGLGLSEEVPVRRRLGRLVPGGWVSCDEAANDQTRMAWAGTQAEQDSAAPVAGACGLGVSSRPYAVTAARSGELGPSTPW